MKGRDMARIARTRWAIRLGLTGTLLLGLVISAGPAVSRDDGPCGRKGIVGTPGDDVLRGHRRNNVIAGKGGNDIIYGGYGNDIICGGGGNDVISGGYGHDAVKGGEGDDLVMGGPPTGTGPYMTPDADLVVGLRGNDTLCDATCTADGTVTRTDDWVDEVHGMKGNDRLYGVSRGPAFVDYQYCGRHFCGDFDYLEGWDGDDHIEGDPEDLFDGGRGEDVCVGSDFGEGCLQ